MIFDQSVVISKNFYEFLSLGKYSNSKLSTSIYDLVLYKCLSLSSSSASLLGVLEIYRDTRAYILNLASENFFLEHPHGAHTPHNPKPVPTYVLQSPYYF